MKAHLFLIYSSIFFLTLTSCKEETIVSRSQNRAKHFDFDLAKNRVSLEEGIERVEYIEVKSDKPAIFRYDGYEIIKSRQGKIYAGTNDELELYIIDTFGTIVNIIDTRIEDESLPNRIRDFTVSNDNLIIFEMFTNRLFFYSLDGKFEKIMLDPDTTTIFRTISFLEPNHLALQKSHDRSNFSIKRNKTMVGKMLDLTNNSLRPIYYNGGSQSRDRLISMRFQEINEGILYNYRFGKEFFIIDKDQDKKVLTFDSKDLMKDDFIEEIDNMIPDHTSEVLKNEYFNNGKMDDFHFYYYYKNIYFFTTFLNRELYWVFYNAVKNEYKTMKFKPSTLYTYKGIPFKPYITNSKDNYFIVFLDGQSMHHNSKEQDKLDPNKTYFLRIYPKYFNQEAWK